MSFLITKIILKPNLLSTRFQHNIEREVEQYIFMAETITESFLPRLTATVLKAVEKISGWYPFSQTDTHSHVSGDFRFEREEGIKGGKASTMSWRSKERQKIPNLQAQIALPTTNLICRSLASNISLMLKRIFITSERSHADTLSHTGWCVIRVRVRVKCRHKREKMIRPKELNYVGVEQRGITLKRGSVVEC